MNRRRFLKFLGVGAAASAVAPAILLRKDPAGVAPKRYAKTSIDPSEPIPGGWVSYRFRYTVTLPPARSIRLVFAHE